MTGFQILLACFVVGCFSFVFGYLVGVWSEQ